MTIANTFTAGTLSVTKTVSGTAASDHVDDVFGVSLACTWYGAAFAIPGGADRDLTVATPVVYTDLPTDAQCVLTETRTGNANQVTVTSDHALLTAGASVTIAADTTLGINVDNRFDKPLAATGVNGRAVTLVGALGLIAMLGGILLFLGRRRRRA
ncbi:DUF5979 domain-containing protein [Microbacterium sp. SORGH_AS_0888]|uniref:DUF5979 domain-containing protein n=1 Tax=Microbacterium sp. SORGH_AS_0888 TaxID=3041791 RepID=UPI00358F7E8B